MRLAADDAPDFAEVFRQAPTPLLLVSPRGTIVGANERYGEIVGQPSAAMVGRDLFEVLPSTGEAADTLRATFERVLASGEGGELPALRQALPAGGGGAPSERTWSCSHVAIRDASGAVAFVLQQAQDITAAPADPPVPSRAPDASLLAETDELRALFMRAPSFMCVLRGPEHRVDLANTAFAELVGRRDIVGRPFRDALTEQGGRLYLDLLDTVYRSGEAFVGKQMRAEFVHATERGPRELFISFVFQPIRGADGSVIAIFVDGNDVTDHVRAEKAQALLVRELHHRVRNTLATVQGVMNSTARTAETIEDYQWAFSGRISSLARTHSLLTEEIQQFVSFPNLLRQEIGAYADGQSERVVLEGPDVELPSQLAVPIGMTIHELSTNAVRHGALSAPGGRVTVTWAVRPAREKRILTCRWIETGGPPVAPPARQGFGSMILNRVLSQQIGAKVDASYAPGGFELAVDIPLVIERA